MTNAITLRKDSYLIKEQIVRESGKTKFRTALDYIFNVEKISDLEQMWFSLSVGPTNSNRSIFNIANIRKPDCMRGTEPEKKNKKTIEFKQHESTLGAERVSNWIRFCVGACEFADTVELKKLMPFLERHVDGVEGFGIGQVIAALGMLLDLAEFYDDYAKKLRAEGKDKKPEQSA